MAESDTFSRVANLAGGAAFGALFGVVGTIFATAAGYFNKDRELDIQMAHIALQILSEASVSNRDTDMDTNTEPQRRFAINALERFSGITMSDGDKEDWVSYGVIPKSMSIDEVCAQQAAKFSNEMEIDTFIKMKIIGCLKHLKDSEYEVAYKALERHQAEQDQRLRDYQAKRQELQKSQNVIDESALGP